MTYQIGDLIKVGSKNNPDELEIMMIIDEHKRPSYTNHHVRFLSTGKNRILNLESFFKDFHPVWYYEKV